MLKHELVSFEWPVPTAGYRWELNPRGSAGEMLTAEDREMFEAEGYSPAGFSRAECELQLVPKEVWPLRMSRPLEENTGLFREFALLRVNSDNAILDFADRYGNLGAQFDVQGFGEHSRFEAAESESERLRARMFARGVDTRRCWEQEVNRMRRCVELYDLLRGGKVGPEAMDEIRRTLNFVMQCDQVGVLFVKAPKLHREALHIVPKSLVGAMWVQFAQAVSGEKEHRDCPKCGRWMEISPATARSNRVYCSDACKARAYRGRREQAKEMAAAGRDLCDIAKELRTRVGTVKGWLK